MRSIARAALLVVGCTRAQPEPATPPSARMATLARCTDATLTGDVRADRLEGAIRQSAARERAAFSVRAGQCEDALGPSEQTPGCLQPLRREWGRMLVAVQSPTPDPIALEVAVRHVGDAWASARERCP